MREILFKAKRKNWEKLPKKQWWVEGYYSCMVHTDGRHSHHFIIPLGTDLSIGTPIEKIQVEINVNTLCQYTGLTDKNGQKIWENDIVDYLGHKGKVKYECGSFGIAFREIIDWEEIEANICLITGCDNSLYACENDNFISLWEIMWNFNDIENSIETIEVIGNIFDNPELLEVE